ncbi:non-symbiotic hemoglobin 2 [Tanacetum coccineum]
MVGLHVNEYLPPQFSVRIHDVIDPPVGNAGRKHVIDETEVLASQQNQISSQFRSESIAYRVVATNGATPESLDTEPAPATFGPSKTATARTVEKGAGEKCFEEMKSTWSEAYDQLSTTIQAEMAK